MILHSKYFTPPLAQEDKNKIAVSIGFARCEFDFYELSEQLVLRSLKCKGLMKETLLQPASLPELKEKLRENGKTLILEHNQNRHFLNRRSIASTHDIFEDLFPFPFSVLGRVKAPATNNSISALPAEFLETILDLQKAFEKLDVKLAETELSCLWIQGLEVQVPVLFHYVRKKRVRVGSSAVLQDLGEKFLAGQLVGALIRERLGVDAAFFYLDVTKGQEPDVISGVSGAVNEMLDTETLSVIPSRLHKPVTEIHWG